MNGASRLHKRGDRTSWTLWEHGFELLQHLEAPLTAPSLVLIMLHNPLDHHELS